MGVWGLGFRVWGLGFRVWGSGLSVSGLGLRVIRVWVEDFAGGIGLRWLVGFRT